MTHLTPSSYPTRGLLSIIMFFVAIYRIFYVDKGKVFRLSEFKALQTRTFAAAFLFIGVILAIAYDIVCCDIKYNQAYYSASENQSENQQTLRLQYTDSLRRLVASADALLETSMVLKSSSSFLLLAALNRVSDTHLQTPFMSSCEFRIYCVYSMISIPLYPIMQLIFFSHPLLTTVVPQMVYHCESLLLMVLFLVMGLRMSRLVAGMPLTPQLAQRMQSIVFNLYLLGLAYAVDFCGLGILNIDIIIHGKTTFTPLVMDILTIFFSLGFTFGFGLAFVTVIPNPIDANGTMGTRPTVRFLSGGGAGGSTADSTTALRSGSGSGSDGGGGGRVGGGVLASMAGESTDTQPMIEIEMSRHDPSMKSSVRASSPSSSRRGGLSSGAVGVGASVGATGAGMRANTDDDDGNL